MSKNSSIHMPGSTPRDRANGDEGQTTLGGVGDVAKSDVRVGAYADVDETNAAVGLAIALAGLPNHAVDTLASVQHDLYDLAADLRAPLDTHKDEASARITDGHVERLDRACEHYGADLDDPEGFVLPGGTVAAALLFQARAVTRRAERTVWAVAHEHPDSVNPLTARYLNRLSSLLYLLARGANAEHGDTLWHPNVALSTSGAAAT